MPDPRTSSSPPSRAAAESPQQLPLFQLRLQTRVGALHLDLELALTSRWTVIFGPSGSGKSTILRAICGLLSQKPRSGIFSNFLAARGGSGAPLEWDRPHHRVAPHRRQLAYAPQGAVLFPHMSVRENISFPCAARRIPSPGLRAAQQTGSSEEIVDQAIQCFQLEALVQRKPGDLSGGERQRVNLARAFAVPHPRLILLDEPFTGIDRALRGALLPRMQERAVQLGAPVLSVTHDVEEALMLGAEVIRLEQGRILDQGAASLVLAEERARMLRILL